MFKQLLSGRPGVDTEKNTLTVVRSLPAKKKMLMPPLTGFNTGYLKGKKHDPL